MSLLELKEVSAYYGQIRALSDISIRVEQGEILTLIGSNGAGKTTTLKAICGQVNTTGTILFEGKDISKMPPHLITRLGLAHVPEGRRIFQDRMEHVLQHCPRLKERLQQKGGTMSGGEQQMLAIGRALMMKPKLLLLDEPSMGLAPVVVEQIFEIIQELNKQGITILLVEQNAFQALQIAHRGYVLQTGKIILEDTAEALLGNEQVKEAYLA
jgi:branched-chain amino acid transport system ATP-binding protein